MGGSSNQQYHTGRKGKDINNNIKREYEEKDFEKSYANETLGKYGVKIDFGHESVEML